MGEATDAATDDPPAGYPGARRPDRTRRIDAGGVSLAAYEWGDPDDPPLLLAHGGFDFAGTMDGFAPLLADAGWRVVSWDQRGHGDSDRAAFYRWEADMRDATFVFADVADGPIPVVGHSKGGSLMTHLAALRPHLVSTVVNIDGIPSRRRMPDVQDHERTTMMSREMESWLDHRRRSAAAQRRPGSLDELATRRAAMNPRLPHDWLVYIASIGAFRSDDGWRWKIDPAMRMGGFGPWRPEWALHRLAEVGQPFLALLATEAETMGFGTEPDDVRPYLPPRGRVEAMADTGHFVHVERPRETADLALEHLEPFRRRPPRPREHSTRNTSASEPTRAEHSQKARTLRHNRVELALWELRSGTGRPLLVLHGLGERSSLDLFPAAEAWPGPVFGLDFTGHGASTVPVGGGYSCEMLMGDADAALAEVGAVTVLGRGLGGYVATLLAGARPDLVRGAVVADGPGLGGGGPHPTVPHLQALDVDGPPDPYALAELTVDVRPPDHARTFAWLASASSGLDSPIAVTTAIRPPWLAEVAAQPGVLDTDVPTALAAYAAVD